MIAWGKPQRWFMESTCGKFRIAKFLSNGVPSYSCFVKGKGWDPLRDDDGRIMVFDTAHAAQQALDQSTSI